MFKMPRTGLSDPLGTIDKLKEKGNPLVFVGCKAFARSFPDTAKAKKFRAAACRKELVDATKMKHARQGERIQNSSFWEAKCLPKSTPEASFWRPAAPWPGKRQSEGPKSQKKEAKSSPRGRPGRPRRGRSGEVQEEPRRAPGKSQERAWSPTRTRPERKGQEETRADKSRQDQRQDETTS